MGVTKDVHTLCLRSTDNFLAQFKPHINERDAALVPE